MSSMHEIVQNVKAAATVALSTLGVGIGTILDLLPDILGGVATIIGIILSVALIRVHFAKYNQIVLETEIARAKESERLNEARKRKESGQPARRDCDQE